MNKNFVTFLVVVFVVAVILGVKVYSEAQRANPADFKSLRVKGEEGAPIQIVEFIDFQCPACAVGAKFLNKYMKDNPGRVRLELKYFPLNMHKHAYLAAQYAECAGRQQKFWPFHDLMVERQDRWKSLANVRLAFDAMIEEVGVDAEKLAACLDRDSVKQTIEADKEEGKAAGVKSTPSYFVNGTLVVGFRNLAAEINKLVQVNSIEN